MRRQQRLILTKLLLLSLVSFFSCQSLSTTPNINMMRTTSKAVSVRVVSYNVLSSHLARPSHFTSYNPAHLEASNRLPIVLKKLEEEMNASKNTILCLQEVSYDWAGDLHTFFANRGYHLVTGLHGGKFSGYMGVCLAWPVETMEVVKVDISRLSDKRQGGWPKRDEKPSTLGRLWKSVYETLPLKQLGLAGKEVIDHWDMSERRFNVLVTAVLREKESGNTFCIGNYHMPCAYYAPMVMTIHSDMAVKHVEQIAMDNGDVPYILAGDFNIKPSEPVYRLLTTGEMDKDDPFWPTPKNGMEWSPSAKAMKSAYAESDKGGAEPNFTNYAKVKDDEPFIDTLDYIFLSPSWKVKGVRELPHRDKCSPIPNLDMEEPEPSDHIMIAASLEVQS
jgi:2',5'-phosphodiesterase